MQNAAGNIGMASILVVDDEPDIRDILKEILEDEGYSVTTASNAAQARELRQTSTPNLVLLDIWMPDTDGITLLREWSDHGLEIPVVMISGHGNVETAVEAVRYGAYDFLEKPLSTAKLLVTVKRALDAQRLRLENQVLKERVEPAAALVGSSAVIHTLRDQIERVGITDSWVLLTGEPGSGKGVVARCLHEASARKDQPFVSVSLASSATESTAVRLFGREDRGTIEPGQFEVAQGGSLFLDEISDLDAATQLRLLNVLQDSRYVRVGGMLEIDINVRIISATNQDIEAAVSDSRFREDLYYRLNVVPIKVPPLRDHREDIPELVSFYSGWMMDVDNLPYRRFTSAAINELRNHHWPGNVRELKNVVQRILILNQDEEIGRQQVTDALSKSMPGPSRSGPETQSMDDKDLRGAREDFERRYLRHHLKKHGGNISEMARAIGVERTHLYRKLKSLGLSSR